jgi:hypothetical protein
MPAVTPVQVRFHDTAWTRRMENMPEPPLPPSLFPDKVPDQLHTSNNRTFFQR